MHIFTAQHSLNCTRFNDISKYLLLSILLMMVFMTNSFANRSYGPVKANDYLIKIVNKNYPNTHLNKNQIMVGILRANPHAFRGGNIHFLKQGVTLNLPSEDDIASISSTEATELIAKQLTFFKRGQTGNFVNKPLVLTSISTDESGNSQSTSDRATKDNDTNHAESSENAREAVVNASADKSTADGQNTSTSQVENTEVEAIPPKIKIKIRQAAQEKSNKEKQLKTLEKINEQQTRTLTTLDQQIKILEDQLKSDAHTAQLAAQEQIKRDEEANTEKASEKTSIDKKADIIAENAISSLEARLSQNNTGKTSPANESVKPEESSDAERTNSVEPADKPENVADSTKVENTDAHSEITVASNQTTKQTDTQTTRQSSQGSSGSEETHTTPALPAGSDKATPGQSLFAMSNKSLYALFAALALGLLLLTYFFTRGNTKQQYSPEHSTTPISPASDTPKHVPDQTGTSQKRAATPRVDISDQEKLLNPVIKTDEIVKKHPTQSADVDATTSTQNKADTQFQEAEIKINMARAYMELGYLDASKEVLEEVLEEGTDDQKATVSQMLSMI